MLRIGLPLLFILPFSDVEVAAHPITTLASRSAEQFTCGRLETIHFRVRPVHQHRRLTCFGRFSLLS